MYSAVKVNGKRLYEYARAGETVDRPEREAEIESFKRTTAPIYNEEAKTRVGDFKLLAGKVLCTDLGC